MSVGRPYILQIDGCVHDGWLILTNVDVNINKEYLYYVLASDYAQSQFQERALGGVVKNLNIERAKNVQIPVPPADVQAQIVAECQAIDEEVAQAEKEITSVRDKIRNAVSDWFARFDKVKVSDVLSLEYGKALPKDKRTSGEYPVMGSNGIDGYHCEYLVEGPTVIIGRKGTAGAVTYVEKSCYPIDTTFYVKPKVEVNMKYLYYVLDHLNLSSHKKGIGVPGVNRNDIYVREVPLPNKQKQDILISEIEKMEHAITDALAVIASAPARRQAVLQKYLWGV